MIKVSYYRTRHRVTVKGHANQDEMGRDIVCAAVTMLTRTLAANCVNAEDHKRMREVEVRLDAGDAEIKAVPCKKLDSVVTLIFDTVCAGYELLSKQYPEYVAYQIF